MLEDAARFVPGDPPSVVAASFAVCGDEWLVHLDSRQLMRMHFAPPLEFAVRWFPVRRAAPRDPNRAGW